ncbi:hypothetical protein SAMD00019534_096830 [Acytostelium subglobosum LB1]|uniref:hypothetical protein n=1 Tax=Acytostelium subglobosum LB1 TaxID=1410327 RepID=UPI000644FEE9|nr:hypothetical protein SAMD00019534_096830 [Acytostelium subglobosum LB1]GAM26508.1 hypothetical protein SAMD00019534_096830 [Acytostelium subglobosum LB1]|eukprot:XP_012750604.1 hypothetical protein SAMD00019534_096830 [Acytostelium subglobosum LB1]
MPSSPPSSARRNLASRYSLQREFEIEDLQNQIAHLEGRDLPQQSSSSTAAVNITSEEELVAKVKESQRGNIVFSAEQDENAAEEEELDEQYLNDALAVVKEENLAEADDDIIPMEINEMPDFRPLSNQLMELELKEVERIATKYMNEPVNEKTASDVLDEMYRADLKNNIFNESVIKHDYDVLRADLGDIHMPTDVSFAYDTTFKDLVDRDVLFKMPLKDTDLVRVITHQLTEFGLVRQETTLKEAPDNIPVPREIIEDPANADLFPDIMDSLAPGKKFGESSTTSSTSTQTSTSASATSTTTTGTGSGSGSSRVTSSGSNNNTTSSSEKTETTATATTAPVEDANTFDRDAIYDPRRVYTELMPVFEDNGVIALPPKEDIRKKVSKDTSGDVVGPAGYTMNQMNSHDLWLMGKPFDLAKFRLGGQENPLPVFSQPKMDEGEIDQDGDEEDDAPSPDPALFEQSELYRHFQEGKGEEWFGPEKVGDKHIDPLNQAMRWYPREHLPTYPFEFIVSHNTQDQFKEDFWINRKAIMLVNVAALNLPEVVERRLAEMTSSRFNAETRVLKIVANNHKSQSENKRQCRTLLNALLHEAYLADPNFVSIRPDNYLPEKPVSTFVPSKSAKELGKFNLFRLTGFPTLQVQQQRNKQLQAIKEFNLN